MFQRALELNPNYATAYAWYAYMLFFRGRDEEGLDLARQAAELDPLSPLLMLNVAGGLGALGRYEESLGWAETARAIDPDFSRVYAFLGVHHWQVSGRLDEAVVSFMKGASLDPGSPDFPAFLGEVFIDLGDPTEAEYWIERSLELGPNAYEPNRAMHLLQAYRNDDAAMTYARKVTSHGQVPGAEGVPLVLLRNHELSRGRFLEARELYERRYPHLLSDDEPELDDENCWAAIKLALILYRTGDRERAERLLEGCLEVIQTMQRLGMEGYGWADAEIFAVRGQRQKALLALRRALAEGVRNYWWYEFEHEPNLESLHDEPEFKTMLDEVRADMAAQLEHVRELERSGELVFLTELSMPESAAAGSLPADPR